MFRKRVTCFALITLCLLLGQRSFAHPMGNFSVNHYSKISVESDGIRVSYIIDLAEIPTYQELQQGNVTANVADPAVTRFVGLRGVELGRGLSLLVDGKRLALRLVSSQVIFPPGAGGLPTMKMGFVYRAAYPRVEGTADPSTPLRSPGFPVGLDGVDALHAPFFNGKAHTQSRPVQFGRKSGSGRDDKGEGGAFSKNRLVAEKAVPPVGNLQYSDNNYPGHAGWKEIVADATGLISSSAPQSDRSAALTNYPTDLLNSPPQDLSAVIQFRYPVADTAGPSTALRSGRDDKLLASREMVPTTELSSRPKRSAVEGPAVLTAPTRAKHVVPGSPEPSRRAPAAAFEPLHLEANHQATPRSAFTELITTRSLSLWFLITAAFIAFGLGALHALEPGHGKTIVAAYLVGSRGTARHALLLGLIVTASHTAGVFALGAITLYASRYIVPEQLYPWLGVFSGLTIAGLGGYMFLRRWSGLDLDHSHTSGQLHSHWFSSSKKSHVAEAARTVSLSQLFALGITGGIIPCPAALVVLLSAFALHRIGLGFFLIIAFSLGLAAVLIGFGMLMVYGRRVMARLQVNGPLTTRWLPVASAAFMTVLGAGIAMRAFLTTGIDLHNLTKEKVGPFLFVAGLGLLLGMRHSTDPDHVVAVSTIVSKQRSIRQAGLIGTIWGLGHTLTIFAVGSMIILFGVVIPPRLGLSMEFSVALMLILLGVLNLTGVMQRLTRYLTRNQEPLALSTKAETLLDRTVGRFGVYQCVRPLVIGIVHGLAGSAAVALLVLSTIHSPVWATVYLLIFGAGTMVGMMCMTAVMAVPLAYAGSRFTSVSRVFSVASGVVSVCFGFFLVYQLGFLGGLFTSHPQWTPR
jgi:ABC-type nickel/cobalt efflux system permease component RcnA